MNRDVLLSVDSRVLMSAGRSLSGIIVPIYLAKLGFSAIELGVLFAVIAITSAALTALVGLLCDRFGWKPFMVLVPLTTAGAAVAFAFSQSTVVIFVAGAIGTFGRGSGAGGGNVGPYNPAVQSLLSSATPSRWRNEVFGRLAFASALGALIGSQLARAPDIGHSLGLRGTDAYRPAFLLIAALAALSSLVALPLGNGRSSATGERPHIAFPRQSRPLLFKLWVTNGINGLGTGFIGPFVTYWFYRRYGAGPGTIGLLFSVINLASMFSNLGAASVARRLGLVRSIVFGRVIQATLLAVMAIAPTFWLAGAVYLVRMLAARVAMPLRQSYTMAMAAPEERASVAGLSNLPSQGTSAVGQIFAGYIFANFALAIPFEIGSLMQLLNTATFWAFFKDLAPPEEVEIVPTVVAAGEESGTEPADEPDGGQLPRWRYSQTDG